jgi:2Fe-2S ferredoxin
MPHIQVTDRDGQRIGIDTASAKTLMETLRDLNINTLLALCGGSCSCATCHVHIAPEWFGKLPPMSEDENDLLDGSPYRNEYSRLSCQIQLSDLLDGMQVQVAQED